MRKIIVLMVLSFLGVGLVYAHPPSKVEVSFKDNVLKVTAAHAVSNPSKHYINLIRVSVNGEKIIEQKFLIQAFFEKQDATYVLPGLKSGDKIEVDAVCNVFGSGTGKFAVEAK